MSVDLQGWMEQVIAESQAELRVLRVALPEVQRDRIGALKAWSPKDEFAHLAYWFEVFALNIAAQRAARPLIDTNEYLRLNDLAWVERQHWDWARVDAAVEQAYAGMRHQLAALDTTALVDATICSVEPQRNPPRPVLRSLIYEVIEHPLHHITGIYRQFDDGDQMRAMLDRISIPLAQRGTAKWTNSARRKIDTYRERW